MITKYKKTMDNKLLKQKIIKSSLRPDFCLPISLLSYSCMARGFTNIMKDKFGFSCENIGVIGDKKFGRLYINYRNSFVGIETFLNKKWSNLDIFFDDIRKERDSLYKKIISNYNFDNPIKSLLEISVSYQEFVNIICFYDCFTKYLDNMDMHDILRPSLRYRISFDHANAVNGQIKFIFKVRKLFQRLGKKTLISPDLFRSMTVDELELFAKTQSLNMDQSRELLCRKFKYYYFYFSDIKKDILIDNDDKDMIHFINKTFFLDKKNIIFGSSASCGVTEGIVFKPSWFNKHIKPGQIIVARSNIIDSEMINKSVAVVVENGGILDHTAVICRELGKPCILSTNKATKFFNNGDKIRVDATNGLVEKII